MADPVTIGDARLLVGDVREALRTLPAESVHCCITSPPYWGLRAYGTEPQVWGGEGDSRCEHEWGKRDSRRGETGSKRKPVYRDGRTNATPDSAGQKHHPKEWTSASAVCSLCGAWRGELGQEPTPALFVEHLVEVFREVRRVLRQDGTLWLNMGDSYYGGKGQHGSSKARSTAKERGYYQSGGTVMIDTRPQDLPQDGLKPKDLCEIPSDVVRALRADGWWLRSRIPWLKRNAMPESTRDRPSQAVEYVLLLTKAERYFYDYEAAKMAPSGKGGGACFGKVEQDGPGSRRHGKAERAKYDASRARRNSDWFFESWQGLYTDDDGEPLAFVVNPAPSKGAHFATFPQKLVEPMVKAGTSERGCCPVCGKPWERVVERTPYQPEVVAEGVRRVDATRGDKTRKLSGKEYNKQASNRTLGWRPGCECGGEPVPCTVLDPFSGAGTTAMVAAQLGRRAVGIELNAEYNRMAERRIAKALRPATSVDETAKSDLPLLAGTEAPSEAEGEPTLPLAALKGFTDA